LWDDYTDRIGGLLSASGVNQVLVIPFYKTSKAFNLGLFLTNWQDVVSAVVTAAVSDMNPYHLARIIHRTARNRPRPPNSWATDFIANNFIKQPIRIVVNDINGLALIAHFS